MSSRGNVSPTCIDLFAGAGGLAEGFRQAGWKIVCAVDNDSCAAKTFQLNFPEAEFFEEDISALDPAKLLRECSLKRGQLDCLIGGPPCQSYSYNNHARSASNQRARLFRQYLRIVETLRPKTLVMENVPGMLTIGGGAIVAEIKRKLAKLGYECQIKILYSEDFGVPQARRRAIVIATRLGWKNSLFPNGTHGPSEKPSEESNPFVHRWKVRSDRPPRRLVTVWDAISDLPRIKNGEGTRPIPYRAQASNQFQKRARRRLVRVRNHVAHHLSEVMLRRIKAVPEGGDWRDMPRRLLPAGMKRARKNDHTKRYGRLSRNGLCCTILTKCDPHWGSYIHPTQDRTISVREAARLQTFPDNFNFCDYISRQYEQLGNAVPPAMARRIAQALKRHLIRARRSKQSQCRRRGLARA